MKRSTLMVFLLVIGACIALEATAGDLPDAEKLIERSIEASGGRAELEKLKNVVIRGTLTMPGMEATVNAYSAPPAKSRSVMTLGQMGTVIEGTNDGMAWSQQPMQPPKLVEGDELAERLRRARFPNYIFYWQEYFDKAETVGVVEEDGQRLYEVVLSRSAGEPVHMFFNSESGLHVKTKEKIAAQGQLHEALIISGDYREVDGLLFPFKSVQQVMGMKLEMNVTSLKVNQDIPESRFDLPKILQKAAPAAEAATPE